MKNCTQHHLTSTANEGYSPFLNYQLVSSLQEGQGQGQGGFGYLYFQYGLLQSWKPADNANMLNTEQLKKPLTFDR